MYTWVNTVLFSSRATRRKLLHAVLDGISICNAKFKKIGEKTEYKSLEDELEGVTEYKVVSKDSACEKLARDLKNENGFELIGFTDQITYIKENGPNDHLEAIWEHPFGSPALLYKVKGLPALIIAGPDIDFNDSMRNKIKSNSATRTKTFGVTG